MRSFLHATKTSAIQLLQSPYETDTLGGESSDLEELDEQSYKLLEEHEQEKAYREEQKQAEVLKQEQVRVRNPQLIVRDENHDQLTQEERDLYYYPHQYRQKKTHPHPICHAEHA